MNSKIKVLLAFDHELPLGGVSRSYKEAIIDPTYELLSLSDNIGVKVNLFTDILCGDFFRRNGENAFYELYRSQLRETLTRGHDVQLHIHPHWIDSTFENKIYKPSSSFKLADFKNRPYPNNIDGIIEKSIALLNEICLPAKHDYQCISYRAGGFNLSPETESILSSLMKHGIKIDSSIAKGLFIKSIYSTVDYKKMPEQCNWYISPDKNLNIPVKDGIWEIPIATVSAGLWTNIIHVLRKYKYKERFFTTGKTIHNGKTKIGDKLRFVFSVRMLGFDVHTLTPCDLMKILDSNVKKYSSEKEIILSTVSHPKNMGVYARGLMEGFVEKARKKYGNDIEFPTFATIYKEKLMTTA